MADFSLTVLGARGSMPVSGDAFARYGGSTSSFTVTAGEMVLLVDCGTALVKAADFDMRHWQVFMTHYHFDHLQGLQFFRPFYEEGNSFTFYGHHPEGMSLQEAIATNFKPPFFPVAVEETQSTKQYVELDEGPLTVGGVDISHARLHHPQGVVGYRFSHEGSSIVLASDHEAGDLASDAALKRLAQGADVLIHDAQYTPEDYKPHRGWGHSTWEDAVTMAEQAGVNSLVLTSHDPWRTDDQIDAIVERARARFPDVVAAHEGLVITP